MVGRFSQKLQHIPLMLIFTPAQSQPDAPRNGAISSAPGPSVLNISSSCIDSRTSINRYITDFIPFDIVGTFSSQSALSFEIVTLLSSKGLTGFPDSMAFATCTLRLCQVNERSLFTLRDEQGFDPEDKDKAKTAILSKLVDIWIYLINHYGPPSFEDLVGKLQEHWDDLEGCAVGFSEACKIDALCECFDDRVFTEIVMAVRRTDQVLMSMLCQRELRQGLKKLLQMAMVEGSAQIEQQEAVTDEHEVGEFLQETPADLVLEQQAGSSRVPEVDRLTPFDPLRYGRNQEGKSTRTRL
ncbi:hypothetical protein SELMODRAFT_432090 [Selaginella moellendorffii]|uniref:Uncharacterized protein n=1 Tax=Selaginella moellendorffii TaxID=88036 RepID=D8TEY5_SELML|nr:hypothetical protein SELMODRAFT_432090 [Selaginella moellendorffii]